MIPIDIEGKTKRFKGNGRKLGYPTANLSEDTDLADGVYFGRANLDKFSDNPALIFIGVPTTMGDKSRRVEVHLLDIPDLDYYDKNIKVKILKFHRSNIKFDNIQQLLKVMREDERVARAWFKS